MITVNRKTVLTTNATIFLIAMALAWVCPIAQAQTVTTFEPTDKFSIPEHNSTISFAASGTYTHVSLENGTWNFADLILNNTGPAENLKVSAKDSNVTIISYQTFNITIVGKILIYTVVGSGTQTFNLGLISTGAEWSVRFNDLFISENEGWSISPDQTLTITGASSDSNVTLFYFVFSDALGGSGDTSNQTFLQQHSVIIVTGVVVVAAAVITVVIWRRNQNK